MRLPRTPPPRLTRRPLAPLLALIPLAAAGCGEDKAQLTVPRLGTTWVMIAAAGGGRALVPEDVQIKKSTDVDALEIPGTGNVTVDMIFAGIRDEDLPAGLTPDALVFTSRNARNTRPIPPLVAPHVLAAPSPPGTAGALVPVSELGLSDDEASYRAERMAALTANLRIADPCQVSDAVFVTPRIPATGVSQIQVLSSGHVYLAFSATSTAILGRFERDPLEMELIGVSMGADEIEDGEAAVIADLGDREVMGPDGLPRPAHLTMTRGGALGHVAVTSERATRYSDDTPRSTDPTIGRAAFSHEVTLSGEPELCVGGQASGSGAIGSGARVGGLWCRTSTGGAWRVAAAIPGASKMTTLFRPEGMRPLALDYGGTVYTMSPAGAWSDLVTPSLNQGCGAVACNRLDVVAVLPASAGDARAVMAGDDGEVWLLRGPTERELVTESLGAAARALFGDEKKGGADPLVFSAITVSPDGAVWLGSQAHFLLRIAPDQQSATRVCRDGVTLDHPVTAIGAASDGRLIISTSPPIVGVGTWR